MYFEQNPLIRSQDPLHKMQILRWVFNILLIHAILDVFSLSLCSATAAVAVAAQQPSCFEADRAALLEFKTSILKDTTEILASWVGRDCCGGEWEGVVCNLSTGRVTGLALQRPDRESALYMKGTLSASLGKLQFLEVMV
ncbi:hypothetical protein Dsin_028775 [Dipteronia sinensis]|uniref:Leucine-rich repeat-containing N-terminal plant-type domain-containing protein n=1 Tax=Dipteronia sinensis TaxID=43782 RepID=A0AAD9ZRI7_9ROSI|nr:hypothetical protein Dsin_028775 [Dipteronia sinensis]